MWLESLLKDARFGVRILAKERGVTVAAVASLALAIGACTAAFSLIDALMLRPLPVPEPHRLVGFTYQPQRTMPGGRRTITSVIHCSSVFARRPAGRWNCSG
jgi:hypothetical protein